MEMGEPELDVCSELTGEDPCVAEREELRVAAVCATDRGFVYCAADRGFAFGVGVEETPRERSRARQDLAANCSLPMSVDS